MRKYLIFMVFVFLCGCVWFPSERISAVIENNSKDIIAFSSESRGRMLHYSLEPKSFMLLKDTSGMSVIRFVNQAGTEVGSVDLHTLPAHLDSGRIRIVYSDSGIRLLDMYDEHGTNSFGRGRSRLPIH